MADPARQLRARPGEAERFELAEEFQTIVTAVVPPLLEVVT